MKWLGDTFFFLQIQKVKKENLIETHNYDHKTMQKHTHVEHDVNECKEHEKYKKM